MTVSALLVCCGVASALNPSLDISQYTHTAWKIGGGFFKGQTLSIIQTPVRREEKPQPSAVGWGFDLEW
jgi:hypothetical protein